MGGKRTGKLLTVIPGTTSTWGGGGSIINRDDIICQPEAISPLGVSNIPSAFSSASSFKGGLIDSSSLGADARSQTN